MQTFARNPVWMPGIALVAASAVAIAPITPLPTPSLPSIAVSATHVRSVELPVQLSASVADLLTLPIIRQWIFNLIDDVVTLGVGLAASGAGIVAELGDLPGTVVDVTQLIFQGQFEAALYEIVDNIVEAVDVIGSPTLGAIILRRQRSLEVSQNFQMAVPDAVVGFALWTTRAIEDVLRSWIAGGRAITAPIFDGNLGGILPAIGETVNIVIKGLTDGAQDLVQGTYYLQQTIAVAMGAEQPPVFPPPLPGPRPPIPATALAAPVSGLAAVDIPDLKGSATTFALETTTEPPITGAEVGADVQESTGAEVGADKAGADKAGVGKLGAGKLGVGKLGAGKAGVGKLGAGKAGVGKAGADKAGAGKAGVGKAGADKAGADKQ